MLGTSLELHRAANATHRWQQSDNGGAFAANERSRVQIAGRGCDVIITY